VFIIHNSVTLPVKGKTLGKIFYDHVLCSDTANLLDALTSAASNICVLAQIVTGLPKSVSPFL